MKKKLKAFTLAEVLITLAIVGVVAALTLPNLIANYQKKQTATKVKKVYTILSQAIQSAIVDYGDITGWDVYDEYTLSNSYEFANKYIKPYLNVVKDCGIETTGDCALELYGLNGLSTFTYYSSKLTKFFLNDGSEIFVGSPVLDSDGLDIRVHLLVDVNGKTKPNIVGKDVFQFELVLKESDKPYNNGKILPRYMYDTLEELIADEPNRCHKNQNGYACTMLLVRDGWEFKEHYPW